MGEESSRDGGLTIPPPIFFSVLPKRKRAVNGPKEKNAFLSCSGAVALRADGGLQNRCRRRLPAFCRLAPGSSVVSALRRVFGAAEIRGGKSNSPCFCPRCRSRPREVAFQRADTQVRPYGIHWEHPPVLPRRTRQRVAKRNARKEENIKCDFAPRPLSVPRRGDWPPGPERPCRARGEGIANSKAPSHVQPPYDTRALGFRAQSRV